MDLEEQDDILEEEASDDDANLEAEIESENESGGHRYPYLDYSLKTTEERSKFVEQVLQQVPEKYQTSKYLDNLAKYILNALDKTERKKREILTDNRMITINRRETSLEGTAAALETGEDGLYNLINEEGDKNYLLTKKLSISKKDEEDIPGMKELRSAIDDIQDLEKDATGKQKYLLKKQLIQMRQDQYILKTEYSKPVFTANYIKSVLNTNFDEHITIDEDGVPHSDGLISFFNPAHISALLCNYEMLKKESEGNFYQDVWFLLQDLETLIRTTLKYNNPMYYDIAQYKIQGIPNIDIQKKIFEDYGEMHSEEYISCLWRQKIPKYLAEKYQKDYIVWYYTNIEYGKWKKCSKCGEIKLAHNFFFSKNKSSKDGYYSICKDCRNKAAKERSQKKGAKRNGKTQED